MPSAKAVSTLTVGGIAMSSEVSRTDDGQIGQLVALPAGSDGDMASYTGVAEITVDMADGYVIGDGEIADVYWTVLDVLYVKYGATVALAGDTVTLTGGEGADFIDSVGLAMVVTEQVLIDIDVDGDKINMIAAESDQTSHVEFLEAGPASIAGVKLLANEAWTWLLNGEYTNPLAGSVVVQVEASCGNADTAASLKIGILYNSA